MKDQHPQLVEAQKRLGIAKDAYAHALESIERQYVKPLASAGTDPEGVAAIRAQYGEVAPYEVATLKTPAPKAARATGSKKR